MAKSAEAKAMANIISIAFNENYSSLTLIEITIIELIETKGYGLAFSPQTTATNSVKTFI